MKDGSLVTGCVPDGVISRGPRKGEPRLNKPVPGATQKIFVSTEELLGFASRYEADTGNCFHCKGEGSEVVAWSEAEGIQKAACDRCSSTGRVERKNTFMFMEQHMKKQELIKSVAEAAELTNAEADRAIKAFTDTITQALSEGDTVTLVGFGTFSVKDRAARTGRNPATGESIDIPAAKVPGFKAGAGLKGAVNA